MRDLLHPPGHRGPLIAAGAVMLSVGVALEQLRITPGAGVQLLVVAALAAVLLWLACQAPLEGGHPHAHQSVLLVGGLLALYVTLLRLADVLGADFAGDEAPAGALMWTGLVFAGTAAAVAVRRNAAIAALLAAIGVSIAVLAAWQWLFEADSVTPYRWLLLLLALAFAITSLRLRGVSLRHAVQMVNAAGLAILAIPLAEQLANGFFGTPELPTFWEFVLLAGGFGLVAYAGADRAPGPAYLGVAVLVTFVLFETFGAGETLEWWPLLLLLGGLAVMAIGLRPRVALPPEPTAYHQDDLPLAARTGDVRVRVHRD